MKKIVRKKKAAGKKQPAKAKKPAAGKNRSKRKARNARKKRGAGKPVRVDILPSKVHGLGLFAGEEIPWGKRVIEYTGQRIGEREFLRRERFYDSIGYTRMFTLDDKTTIDALIGGNPSAFINHSDKPNLGVLREKGRIFFYSLVDIKKGKELTFDYGFQP